MASKAFVGLTAVHELRFHLCQTSKTSEHLRNFLTKSYEQMKRASPTTPVLIREANGCEPKIYARFGAVFFRPPTRLCFFFVFFLLVSFDAREVSVGPSFNLLNNAR